MVFALPLPEGDEVVGEGGVGVHPLDLHVPLVQAVVHQLNLEIVLTPSETTSNNESEPII